MNVNLTAWHETEICTWCERSKECVTVTFADGFLSEGKLCWLCLQKSVKVRHREMSAKDQALDSDID